MAGPVALGGMIGGSLLSAFGAYQGGQADRAMYDYRARVAQINAGIAQEQANAETVAGERRAEVSGFRTGERMGLTRSGMAAGGLDLGTGSARQVLSSEAEIGQFEQASIRSDAARRRYGQQVAAFGDIAESQVDTAAGKQAQTAGYIKAGSSLLGGAAQVSEKWPVYLPSTPYDDPSTA